ncbi:MAG TPA: nuclear transport factor 2 family protein [Candidatus Solibacter sp.]|nr:nuclear transport factor 2 family protein [Candidatus Solibacter sp.]
MGKRWVRIRTGWEMAVMLCLMGCLGSAPGSSADEITAFNKQFAALHLKMDHAGILAMWAEDGVDLMPGEAPLIGKKAIAAWLGEVQKEIAGHKVTTEDLEFHDIAVSGDWASEWATEHQVVEIPGKPAHDGYGKLALVLHRENGEWKIKQEMWNDAPKE